ncbi:MAG: hypothetical protein IKO55_07870 [Kiritimatiellae bacterium]|nr:hypothetical protein [Kiritimatiellia bacterium]
MKRVAARKGSALLIVLGMIGIMVISAVAFSAYMRYSRLPSSYLRRTSASRHLAHAAIAEAIDMIDASIGNNPHPGVGTAATIYPRYNGRSEIRNYWRDRCYIGTNQLAAVEDTVSVLNLEALAYIPAALVNDARYYSRHTLSASWKRLGYDAGRYAFFAIDVSDFLNVNKTPADFGRNSSDRGKFTFAHVLENNNHTSYTIQPSAWDTFLENYVDIQAFRDGTQPAASKMPFMSLADMGLAMYMKAGSMANTLCPFLSYIAGGSAIDNIADTAAADMLRRFTFVTDGLQPTCAAKSNLPGDLSDSKRQPFPRMKKGKGTKTTNREVLTLVDGGTSTLLEQNMCLLDMISLYDYLDENDVPVSLALPTTERVPMICGLQSTIQLNFKPKVDEAEVVEGGAKKKADCKAVGDFYFLKTTCFLDPQGPGGIGGFSSMYMFPFRRDKDVQSSGFKGETALRICFGVGTPGLRTRSDSPYVLQQGSEFEATGVGGCAMRPKVQSASCTFSDVDRPEDAVKKLDTTVNFNEVRSWFQQNPLFWVKKKFVVTAIDPSTGAAVFAEDTGACEAGVSQDFHPVNADGTGDGGFTADLVKQGGKVMVRPYMTVTSRITRNGDTLDLVPACIRDDNKYNGINNDVNIANIGGGAGTQPIMTFCGDKDIEFSLEAFQKGDPIEVKINPTDAQSLFCPDPRWNFAPENFVRVDEALNPNWYTETGNPKCGLGRDGRDGDIFMFVSNQGYMQSISELAFLPRTSIDMGGGSEVTGNAAFSFDKSDFVKDDVTATANWNLMWRTYRLYPQGGLSADGIYDIGIFDGGCGQRINPYTTSHDAMMAAFANTPYSWWAASTNNQDKALEDLDASAFNKDYAFNAMNSKAKFAWKDLELVADNISAAMRANGDGDWCAGYDSLDWAGQNSDLAGVTFQGDTCDLYDVDRKFLYGFWRDCFAAKQQLFLVFVRAEPMMMGSGAVGQAPPQLGARAMALVWRNPGPSSVTGIAGGKKAWPQSMDNTRQKAMNNASDGTTDANRPHQTRILFYRQFE